MLRILVPILVLLLSAPVAAGEDDFGHETVRFDPSLFEKQRASIERELSRGERYAEISDRDKQKVVDSLEIMGRLLEGRKGLHELNDEQRTQLFNHQESINNLLTGAAEDSRLICRREMKTGSHRQEVKCKTVAQRRFDADRAGDVLRGANRRLIQADEN
ncbi:MAG: hypothetical protein KDJ14_07485 [Xanthomonadales bacterium]|nr:hypothetical protein [Xanthomonadales bacterium]